MTETFHIKSQEDILDKIQIKDTLSQLDILKDQQKTLQNIESILQRIEKVISLEHKTQ